MINHIILLLCVAIVSIPLKGNQQDISYQRDGYLLNQIAEGGISDADVKRFLQLCLDIEKTINIEGSEYVSEVIDEVIISNTESFIREYGKLTKEEKKVIDDYIVSMREDADIPSIMSIVRKIKTLHFRSKNRILNSIKELLLR